MYLNAKVMEVLDSLRANIEDKSFAKSGSGSWEMVYLDNARPDGMDDKQFRACLASLSKMGVYKVVDGWAWGQVKY